jgi:serine O-acetyltransferase
LNHRLDLSFDRREEHFRADPATDALWERLIGEAKHVCATDPALHAIITDAILGKGEFYSALSGLLAHKLRDSILPSSMWETLFAEARMGCPDLDATAQEDLAAVVARDPATEDILTPFLCYKGFHALQCHRVGHWLWSQGRCTAARIVQSRVSEVFSVDIHPAVSMGRRVFIDHGTGIVIGETAVVGDDVSILQHVTLGGTGKGRGDRHPKIRDGALLSANATVLGNIEIGRGATVGAGSVVLKSVPPFATAVGVPARTLGG